MTTEMSASYYYYVVWALMAVCRTSSCFNVDLSTASLRHGDSDSMFGFTVAQHVEHRQKWIIVGAPNAQTGQQNVIRGGAVYRCHVEQPHCEPISFDIQGNNREWNGMEMVQVENKTMQWFGASLDASSSAEDSTAIVVACAPRYVYHSRSAQRRDPIGACYVSKSRAGTTPVYARYSPCRKGAPGHNRLGHCQFGFSIALADDNSFMAAGAVGSYFWQGQVIAQDLNDDEEFLDTPEGPTEMDNTFMGYSIAVGHFDDDSEQDYVVGIPKGHLTGMVIVLSSRLVPLYNVSGEQTGEYFGSAVAVDDFDGDGLDDVAVGAPFFTNSSTEVFDIGRVYVFYQTSLRHLRKEPTRLSGSSTSGSRFGFTLSPAGDLNLDGFNDLVVGSPYDGPDGSGVVYVYHGSPGGIRPTPSQVCQAADIDSRLATFGYSLSAGVDMDSNGYPDILAGAYESNQAVYLRSRPIIRINSKLTVDPELIDLEHPNCHLRDNSNATCYAIELCMNYTGLNVPSQIELGLSWILDSTKEHSQRALFRNDRLFGKFARLSTITLSIRRQRCRRFNVYSKSKIRDKVQPVTMQVNYTLINTAVPVSHEDLEPVLDDYIPTVVTAQGHIKKHCALKRICIPDLIVNARSSVQIYPLGSEAEIELSVAVENRGEDAFEATVRIFLPADVDYISFGDIAAPRVVDVSCVKRDNNTDGDIVCDVGNPLPASRRVRFKVRLSASKATSLSPFLRFNVVTSSSNEENLTTMHNNAVQIDIPVKAVVNVTLTGVSHPENVLANDTWTPSFESEDNIGPEVIHLYEITNFGPSDISAMQTVIRWPMETYEGDYLLYLLETPRVVRGEGECWAENVNPLNVTLDGRQMDDTVLEQLAMEARLRQRSARRRRQVAEQYVEHINCGEEMPGCTIIRCETGAMVDKDDSVIIQIRSRVFTNTLILKQSELSGFRAKSQAVTSIVSLPYKNVPYEVNAIDTREVETFLAVVGAGPVRKQIQFWVIVLAIVGGCLLLFLIVIILWKLGFFERRRRPEDAPPMYKAVRSEEFYN